eukprot:sb/3466558/
MVSKWKTAQAKLGQLYCYSFVRALNHTPYFSSRFEYDNEGGNYTLTINDLSARDSGRYTCSPKHTSDVKVADGSFMVQVMNYNLPDPREPSIVTISEGSGRYLNCNYKWPKESYNLRMFWSWNDAELEEPRGEIGETESMYRSGVHEDGRDFIELKDMQMGASGVFACNYEYPDGQVYTMSFDIKVEEREGPQDVIRTITFREDYGSGTLMCDLSSLREVTVERFYWEINGEELEESDEKYTITEDGPTKRLVVNDVTEEDTGTYRCVAELQYYPIAVRFNVNVIGSTKDIDFDSWTPFSVCDKQNKKFRFRTCVAEDCVAKYGYVYEVDTEDC